MLLLFYQINQIFQRKQLLQFWIQQMECMTAQLVSGKRFIAVFQIMQKSEFRVK